MPWLNGQATIPEKWELGSSFSLQCIRGGRRCRGCVGNTLLPASRWRWTLQHPSSTTSTPPKQQQLYHHTITCATTAAAGPSGDGVNHNMVTPFMPSRRATEGCGGAVIWGVEEEVTDIMEGQKETRESGPEPSTTASASTSRASARVSCGAWRRGVGTNSGGAEQAGSRRRAAAPKWSADGREQRRRGGRIKPGRGTRGAGVRAGENER
jgi:hypothetical protein